VSKTNAVWVLCKLSFLRYTPLLEWSIPSIMANLIITYWRDIPSAVSVKIGRKEEKRMLDNRFMEAIDMAAMRSGATESDAYLADWRRGEPVVVSDDMVAEVEKARADLESHYTQEKIKALIATGGKES
jgi:Virulence factor